MDSKGNTIISGVGDGEIAKGSTDAVNGGQLYDLEEKLGDINNSLDGGMNFGADEGTPVNRKLGDTLAINGDKNITTTAGKNGIQVGLNKDLDLGSDGSVKTGNTTVSNEGVVIKDGPSMTKDRIGFKNGPGITDKYVGFEGGPQLTANGIDAGGKQIHGVAAGTAPTDAVNVGQLQDLSNNVSKGFSQLNKRIGDVKKGANAGTASALAASTVPQAWIAGESMVGVGLGSYEGQSAVSVGISKMSDNGRWILQSKVTGDTQDNFGVSVGMGWHW